MNWPPFVGWIQNRSFTLALSFSLAQSLCTINLDTMSPHHRNMRLLYHRTEWNSRWGQINMWSTMHAMFSGWSIVNFSFMIWENSVSKLVVGVKIPRLLAYALFFPNRKSSYIVSFTVTIESNDVWSVHFSFFFVSLFSPRLLWLFWTPRLTRNAYEIQGYELRKYMWGTWTDIFTSYSRIGFLSV